MAKIDAGTAWELFAVMDENNNLTRVVAKDPNRPSVIDVTDDIVRLLHQTRSSPPAANPDGY